MNLTAFFPSYANKYYYRVDPALVGIIFSMFQLALIIFSPIVGASMSRVGRKNMILMGFGTIILCTIGYGAISRLPKECEPKLNDPDPLKIPSFCDFSNQTASNS
jgi:MFS family permease